MSKYWEKLKDGRWQQKRLRILERDKFKCLLCSATNDLHIHHSYYQTGLDPWEYEDRTLWTLCGECHRKIQEIQIAIQKDYSKWSPGPGQLLQEIAKIKFWEWNIDTEEERLEVDYIMANVINNEFPMIKPISLANPKNFPITITRQQADLWFNLDMEFDHLLDHLALEGSLNQEEADIWGFDGDAKQKIYRFLEQLKDVRFSIKAPEGS